MTFVEKHTLPLSAFGSLFLSLLLFGCASNRPGTVSEPLVKRSSVHGGQAPVSGSVIQLYAVGTTGDGSAATPLLTQPVSSAADGTFAITGDYTCPTPSTLVYLTATGGNPGLSPGTNNAAIALLAALGPCGNLSSSTVVSVNELTTVAAVSALAPFMSATGSVGSGSADATALTNAFTLASQYVNTTTGTAPGSNVPAGLTVPVAQLNTLANILSSCVNSAGGVAGDGSTCGTLFAATTPNGGTAPANVMVAGLNITNNPTANVANLYALAQSTAPFQPMLPMPPSDWTVQPAAPSGLLISSNSLDFPATLPGFTSVMSLALTNQGASSVTFNSVSIVGANSSDFSISAIACPAGNVLSSGASCPIQVSFAPSALGQRSAYLNILTTAPNATLQVALTGVGEPGSGPPLVFSPASLDFTKAGVPQTVTLINNGSAAVVLGGTQSYSPTTCGTTLAAQSICTISIYAFSIGPTVQNYTVPISTSTSALTQAIPVRVEVSALSGVTFSAYTANLGTWAVGVTSTIVPVNNLMNTGSSPPLISGSIAGPNASDFAFVYPAPFYGNNGYGCYNTYCEANITFTPSGTGLRTAMIVTQLGNVQLSGIGIPVGPSFVLTLNGYASIPLGTSSSLEVDLRNNGTTTITPVVTITGANASDYAIVQQSAPGSCGAPVISSSACAVYLAFTPSALGERVATLTITDSASGISQSVNLTSTGFPSAPTITPATLSFGNIALGMASTAQSATISADNGDAVSITPLSGTGFSPGDFTVSNGTCATQTPCQVSVVFRPTANGTRSANFQVEDLTYQTVSYLSLGGTGGLAVASLSAPSLTFPARDEGTTSIPQTITVTNTGAEPLIITGVTFAGVNVGDFSLQGNTCGSAVPAGSSCAISVSFSPMASGARSANLVIVSNAASSPDMVPMMGTGN